MTERLGFPSDDDANRLRPVVFDFWLPQHPEISWQVLGLGGHEEISTPYQFEVELACPDASVDPEELLGADCELLLDRNGLTRIVFGLVAAAEIVVAPGLERDHEGARVRVLVVPAFRLLEQEVDTRFFMGQTAIEILRDRLGSALAAYGRELDVESRIVGHYNRRDYCVQFRESTFDFCSRIMEEEGIAYVFVADHEAQREVMVLVDNNQAYTAIELLVPTTLPIVSFMATAAEEIDRESIQSFEWRRQRTPNRVVARGYNFKNPGRADEGQAEQPDRVRPVAREHYLQGESRQITDNPVDDPEASSFNGVELNQRAALAARLLQRHNLESVRGRGRSNAIGFAAGGVFELAQAPEETGGEHQFLIVRVEHQGKVNPNAASSNDAYQNRFTCVGKAQVFRPAQRTPQPRVHGVQTGVVVGRAADEVYTDALGRIRVAFHRDREGADHEHTSCWIRVAQMWAGNGYGTMMIPRVGMEVVVAFVDGNPDCPLVTGCVYNGSNAPPYPLPSELSKSTLKTSSTPGEGFNELRIEDAGGREQIFVHAQRRMDLRVRGTLLESSLGGREEVIGTDPGDVSSATGLAGSHNTLVHGQVNHRIEHSRFTLVESSDFVLVNEDRIVEVFNNQSTNIHGLCQLNAPNIVVEASAGISHKAAQIEIAGSSLVSVKGGERVVLQSNNSIELVVGQSFISITPTGIDISAGTIRLNSGGGVEGRALEGQTVIPGTMMAPLDALTADDGRLHKGGGGGGGGGGGDRESGREIWEIEPHHAPPMVPVKPPRPDTPVGPAGGRRVLQLNWLEDEIWCSEPASLWARLEGYDGTTEEALVIDDAVDGSTLHVDVIRPGPGEAATHLVSVCDVIPRRIGATYESGRALRATVADAKTDSPTRLRFLNELPKIRYAVGRARFDIEVVDHEVIIGGTIEYTRGWIYYIIRLGELVPDWIGGTIGGSYYGSTDWRYCRRNSDEGEEQLEYWNAKAWVAVPPSWTSDLGTKLYGMGVWLEGKEVKTQFGKLAWPPDLAPTTWTLEGETDWTDSLLQAKASHVSHFWDERFDLVRGECRGHELHCCRHRVRCKVAFKETSKKTGGIIVARNHGRANASVWPIHATPRTFCHEWGHHLGNPDEYEGATSVDPTVNDDGAKAGIDEDSIMGGGGKIVRRRHFNTVCKALAKAVAEHLGKDFTFVAREALP